MTSNTPWLAWIPQGSGTINHTAGSLAMLPREKNGVVDSNLKVCGQTSIEEIEITGVSPGVWNKEHSGGRSIDCSRSFYSPFSR
ncbi:gmc oxidoreductase [Moniliophthora roreri]|nr:gmc oxidoreductase [Moniliophthora roreri]